LNKPDLFIDYIHKRTYNSKNFVAENEMCFLGFHLEKGLNKPGTNFLGYLDESWARKIDYMYYPEIANIEKKRTMPNFKIGRNDTCPCNSGLKYKKCHGKK
jgi:hypothetical protein